MTKYKIAYLFLALLFVTPCLGQKVNSVLELFLNNKIPEAEKALLKLANDPNENERGKAAIALTVIYNFNYDDEPKVKYFVQGVQALEHPDPYLFTFWGGSTFINYPASRQQIIDFYANRKQIHPDIISCFRHLQRNVFERNNQFDSIVALCKRSGYIDQWELLGPFEYADGYGYNNDEGALQHPERNYQFVGLRGAPFKWFPLMEKRDMMNLYLSDFITLNKAGKSYLQSFIHSDKDQELIFNLNTGSDVRIWVNDVLVFQNRKNIENIRSLTAHFPVKLYAGNNRILIQSGKKPEYGTKMEVYFTDSNNEPQTNIYGQLNDRSYKKGDENTIPITDSNITSFNATYFAEYTKQHPDEWLEQILRVEEYNSNNDKAKTLDALIGLRKKFPNSYYLTNIYYNNKSNLSYNTKDKFLSQNCEDCFASLYQKYNESNNNDSKTKEQEALAKLESKFPQNSTVKICKIDQYISNNEYGKAENLIATCLSSFDNKINLYDYKSSLLTAQGKKDENCLFLKGVVPQFTNTSLTRKLADYYLDKNDSVDWNNVSLNDAQFNILDNDYSRLIDMYKNSKKYDSAELVFGELMLKKPNSAVILEQYGDFLIDKAGKGDKEKAIDYYKQSLVYYPQDYELIKKIGDNQGIKAEVEILSPQTLKEIYASKKISMVAVPDRLQHRNWVILYSKQIDVFYAGALNKYKGYFFYKILNDAGIKYFKELDNSNGNSELLIFKNNGEIDLPEGGRNWVLTNLKIGDIIGLKEEYVNQAYAVKSNHFQETCYIDNSSPYVEVEHQVLISKALNFEPKLLGNTNDFKMQKTSWNKNFNLYSFHAENPSYVEPESFSNDPYPNITYMAVSNYRSWDEIAKWYWDIASPKLEASDSVSQLVKVILKDAKNSTQFEKAKLLYNWIEANINYSSQSFRQDNYVPQKPSKVLEDKLGDCKDLAALYLLMCQNAGISGNFVLVNSNTYAQRYLTFPNDKFNHCITRIYPDGKPLYVELTSKYLPFAMNPSYSFYGYGLEVEADKICQAAPIVNANNTDLIDIKSDLRIDSSDLIIKADLRLYGVTSSVIKESFEKADSNQINMGLQKMIYLVMPNGKMQSCRYNKYQTSNDSLVVNYTLTDNDMYLNVADLEILKVPTYINRLFEESMFTNMNRKTDLNVLSLAGYVNLANNEVTIHIPEGKTLYKKPSDIKLANKFYNFDISYQVSNEKIIISKAFKVNKLIIPKEEFADYKLEMEKAYKADINTVVFQ